MIEKELAITDERLASLEKLLDAIPECPIHGRCVPHAIEWVKEQVTKISSGAGGKYIASPTGGSGVTGGVNDFNFNWVYGEGKPQ